MHAQAHSGTSSNIVYNTICRYGIVSNIILVAVTEVLADISVNVHDVRNKTAAQLKACKFYFI